MFLPVCRAWLLLIRINAKLSRRGFAALYDYVRAVPLRDLPERSVSPEAICRAVDLASIWYWKQIPCLQRSAAATCLLRQSRVPAELLIGAQSLPFRAHAWVEVNGRVVNDKSYIAELYAVVDRC